eukprot:gene11991-15086_t
MGCGTSSHANEVQGGDNERSPAPHAVPKTRPTSMAGAVADEGAVVIDNSLVAVKGLNECMEYLASAGDLLEGIDDCPALKAAVDIFESGGAILHTIANVITPPPGGQVIGAVLAIGCHDEEPSQGLMPERKQALKKDIETFQSLAIKIHVFVKDTTDQNWITKMGKWLGLAVDTHEIVASAQRDQEKRLELIQMAGGLDAMLADENAIAEQTRSEMSQGPHDDIKNLKLRQLWAKRSKTETMKWSLFKKIFPVDVVLDEDIKVELMRELDGDNYEAFKAAVEAEPDDEEDNADNWKSLEVAELNKAFPKDGDDHLLQREEDADNWKSLEVAELNKAFPKDGDEHLLQREEDADNWKSLEVAELNKAFPKDGDEHLLQREEDADNWKSLEVAELNKAFPKDGDEHLLQRVTRWSGPRPPIASHVVRQFEFRQLLIGSADLYDGLSLLLAVSVKELKEKFRDQCLSNNLGDKPVLLSSRDTEIKQVVDYLQAGKRLVLVCGGPGEGKQSVAVKAVYDWQEQYKIKGVSYTCDLITVKTKENLEACMTDALYKVVKAGPKTAKLINS